MPKTRRSFAWSPEAQAAFRQKYPDILDTKQVSELLRIPISTLYAWRRQGKFKHCCMKLGRHLRFVRDCLLDTLLNGVPSHDN